MLAYFANPHRSNTCPTDTARGKPLAIFFSRGEDLRGIKQEALRSEPPSMQLFRQDETRAANPYSFSRGSGVNGGRLMRQIEAVSWQIHEILMFSE